MNDEPKNEKKVKKTGQTMPEAAPTRPDAPKRSATTTIEPTPKNDLPDLPPR